MRLVKPGLVVGYRPNVGECLLEDSVSFSTLRFGTVLEVNTFERTWKVRVIQWEGSKETLDEIEESILALPGVGSVHHMHLWSLDGEHNVLTAHLVMHHEMAIDEIKELKLQVRRALSNYHLEHTTIEIELIEEECRDE